MQINGNFRFVPRLNLESIFINLRQYSILKGALIRSNEESGNIFSMTHRSSAYIITGIQGNGKKLAAEAFAGTAAMCGYQVYRFPVSELIKGTPEDTLAEIGEFLDELEAMLSAPGRKYFLLLDDIWLFNDDSRTGKIFFSKLWDFMESCAGHTVIAAAFDGAASELCEIFRGKCVRIIPLRKPDPETRTAFFESSLSDFFNDEEGVSAQYMGEMTEGFTYGELNALAEELLCMAKGYCLEDTEEEAVPLRDEIRPTTLISKEEIDETVEDIVMSRYSGAEKGNRRSIFNYPRAAAVQSAAAVQNVGEIAVQSAQNIVKDNNDPNKIVLMNMDEQLSKDADMGIVHDPDLIDSLIIDKL